MVTEVYKLEQRVPFAMYITIYHVYKIAFHIPFHWMADRACLIKGSAGADVRNQRMVSFWFLFLYIFFIAWQRRWYFGLNLAMTHCDEDVLIFSFFLPFSWRIIWYVPVVDGRVVGVVAFSVVPADPELECGSRYTLYCSGDTPALLVLYIIWMKEKFN